MKNEYIGNQANEFAKTLREVQVDGESWEIHYLDETTGDEWKMDYLGPEYHGGGTPRLRRKMNEPL